MAPDICCVPINTDQDIRAEEAKKDWRGERATMIQELIATVNLAERKLADMRERLAELEEYGDELLDGEEDEKMRLYRDIERQRLVTAEHSYGVR